MNAENALIALAQVAEQMGFLTALGPAEAADPAADSLVMALGYAGAAEGTVVLAASPGLAEALARNLLVLDPAAAVSPDDARDALAELANIAAGNILPLLHGDGEFRLAQPRPGSWTPGRVAAHLECAEGILRLAVA